jgi:hypothetical protein
MPAPIVLSSVVPSWVLLWARLAAGAAAVMAVTVPFGLPRSLGRAPGSRSTLRRDGALRGLRTMRSRPGETSAGRSQAARKERLRCQA